MQFVLKLLEVMELNETVLRPRSGLFSNPHSETIEPPVLSVIDCADTQSD